MTNHYQEAKKYYREASIVYRDVDKQIAALLIANTNALFHIIDLLHEQAAIADGKDWRETQEDAKQEGIQ